VEGTRNGSWSCFTWLLSLPTWGADVDGLACFLHRHAVCSRQRGGFCRLAGATLSRRIAVGGGAFLGGAKPPGLDIRHGVDRPGSCETESYMEKLAFTRPYLSRVRGIMAIMCVALV
jgi:hypothetical protein